MTQIKNMAKEFREKINHDGVIGVFSKTCDPALIEIMGYAGMDFVIIDLEHGPNSVQTAQNLIRAAQVSGIFPIVRTKESCESVMSEVLDIGTGGIQVPQINSQQDAQRVIRMTKFAPLGERGVCRFVRAAEYSALNRFEYFKQANESVVILQIEGNDGVNHLEEIINIGNIDIVFIGPYDLSQSLGVPGEIDHPLVQEKMKHIVDVCACKGIATGTFVDTMENAKKWRSLGVKYIAYSVDMGIYHDAVKSIVEEYSK